MAVSHARKRCSAVLKQGESEIRILSKNTSYPLILASCLVGLLVQLAAMALGANLAYYLMFAMVAWLFALLVYYTVKLM